MDPNTFNVDLDPGLWPNLDPDPDPGPYYKFWKKKIKNNFREEQLSFLKVPYVF